MPRRSSDDSVEQQLIEPLRGRAASLIAPLAQLDVAEAWRRMTTLVRSAGRFLGADYVGLGYTTARRLPSYTILFTTKIAAVLLQLEMTVVASNGMIASSAVTQLIGEHLKNNDSTHPAYFTSLALQVQHNLQHQHHWTDLAIQTHSPLSPNELLPRPLLSGLPPQRLYVHPDEQIELLSRESQRKKRAKEASIAEEGERSADVITEDAREVLQPEREWVLPTNLKEKWSLRRFAEVFDRITMVPEGQEGMQSGSSNKWRTTKRVLLATVDSDSTVVYYIVHDGLVKPRQN